MRLRPVSLNLDLESAFAARRAEAYERLLMDVIKGRLTHFMRRDELEAACVAMRAQARPVIDRLLDDARAAPWVAEAAFHAAALDLAQAGIAVLRKA